MSIAGRSILEDSNLFYKPLNDLLENCTHRCDNITRIDLNFEYLNGSSARCLVSMIHILEKVYEQGNEIIINWYFDPEDESMYEMGQLMQSMTDIPFNILENESLR